ncbi:MAG: hypothetical protein GYA63_05200 [Armatimonadetes bacterium]|jgi:spoIIIJ-associated protein|nr:hypothetical protein [Armatimonadota bacterium]
MTEPEPNMMSDLQEMTPELAREIAQDLVNAAGFELTAVITDPADGYTAIDLQGNDTGYLTARQGEALNAFQHLLCLMVSRATGERARIVVDAGQYRAKRAEALVKTARELAQQVRDSGQEVEMDPLSAAERRVVHSALLDEPGVRTYSEGEEPERRVVISPEE